MNNSFTAVFSNNITKCPPQHGNHTINSIQFTPAAAKIIKVSSSARPYGISSRFLSDNMTSMAVPLAIIFTKSMQTGTVREYYKCRHA